MLLVACASQRLPSRYRSTTGSDIYFSGGKGDAREDAIIIRGALRQSEGVEAEYYFLSRIYGVKDKAWRVNGQTIFREEKSAYDVVEIRLIPSGKTLYFYFDVSKLPWGRSAVRPDSP